MFMKTKEVEALRAMYPEGTVIECLQMRDDPCPIPGGTLGTVKHIDDAGHIHASWETGSSLSVVPGVDVIRKVHAKVIVRNPNTNLIMSDSELAQWANDVHRMGGAKGNPFSSTDFPERLKGHHCNCGVTEEGYTKGVFTLRPLDDESVKEGGKAYMCCEKCGGYSHL